LEKVSKNLGFFQPETFNSQKKKLPKYGRFLEKKNNRTALHKKKDFWPDIFRQSQNTFKKSIKK
jgi:hypothetical protein